MTYKSICVVCSTFVLAGCASQGWQPRNPYPATQGSSMHQPAQYAPTQQNAYVAQNQQMQVQQNQIPQNAAPVQVVTAAPSQQVLKELEMVHQRVQRLERAMVRLDRRMQLIERQELGRMSGLEADDRQVTLEEQNQLLGALPQQAAPQQQSLASLPVPPAARSYPQGMTPVSARAYSSEITSSLQAAPQQQQLAYATQQSVKNRLPSLADDVDAQKQQDASIAVWTVRYNVNKIWPDRNQLPASREVVDTIKTGKPVALFARGAEPSSKQFRERVRALSRYLSKVSDSSNVAISAMPADHLDSNTIEIFATR